MRLKSLEIGGFKSFGKKGKLEFDAPISAIVGPNGSGKSNIAEGFRFVLGEQSMKSLRGKRGEDLIFSGTAGGAKQNKAGIKVSFDNSDRTLPIDFDEVSIERTVHRDGVNEYGINGSSVRLKDINELLSSANIGSTGHHIISQGEADRILNNSPKERRLMIEDALGLKIFQYKKTESQRKLDKTEENIAQVQSLRKEIAPHIRFLKKQVEKIEKSKELLEKLKVFYREYLKREDLYIKYHLKEVEDSLENPTNELKEIDRKLEEVKSKFNDKKEDPSISSGQAGSEQEDLENKLQEINTKTSDLNRQIGQIEGEINSLGRLQRESEERVKRGEITTLPIEDVKSLKGRVDALISESESVGDTDIDGLRNIFIKIKDAFQNLFSNQNNANQSKEEMAKFDIQVKELQNKKVSLEEEILDFKREKESLDNQVREKAQSKDTSSNEKEIFELMTKKNDLETKINSLKMKRENLQRDEGDFKREMTEAGVLAGREAVEIQVVGLSTEEVISEERSVQLERRRELEKMKIRVEEFGAGSGEEITKEYDDANERDVFLIKEIEDLEKSSSSLKELISELDEQINTKFREGVKTINAKFQEFFELMFGGGEAELRVVKNKIRKKKDTDIEFNEDEIEEEQEAEEGIDIHVGLPRKKIKGLIMLSGGERALTSIALIFAMSAVNPPPFIILDETDAALDEANSRKYADMIENLSKHSQLILITHNRETMSRAGVIYGVTMTQGISQLLSIKFEEGVEFAK